MITEAEFQSRVQRGQQIGWIYFAEAGGDGPIKIGWAKDPAIRLKQLQTGQAMELGLIGVIPGTRHLENELHRRLRRARQVGEWFGRWHTIRLANRLIAEHGIFVTAVAANSRNSPEVTKKGRLKNKVFLAEIREELNA